MYTRIKVPESYWDFPKYLTHFLLHYQKHCCSNGGKIRIGWTHSSAFQRPKELDWQPYSWFCRWSWVWLLSRLGRVYTWSLWTIPSPTWISKTLRLSGQWQNCDEPWTAAAASKIKSLEPVSSFLSLWQPPGRSSSVPTPCSENFHICESDSGCILRIVWLFMKQQVTW